MQGHQNQTDSSTSVGLDVRVSSPHLSAAVFFLPVTRRFPITVGKYPTDATWGELVSACGFRGISGGRDMVVGEALPLTAGASCRQ